MLQFPLLLTATVEAKVLSRNSFTLVLAGAVPLTGTVPPLPTTEEPPGELMVTDGAAKTVFEVTLKTSANPTTDKLI